MLSKWIELESKLESVKEFTPNWLRRWVKKIPGLVKLKSFNFILLHCKLVSQQCTYNLLIARGN